MLDEEGLSEAVLDADGVGDSDCGVRDAEAVCELEAVPEDEPEPEPVPELEGVPVSELEAVPELELLTDGLVEGVALDERDRRTAMLRPRRIGSRRVGAPASPDSQRAVCRTALRKARVGISSLMLEKRKQFPTSRGAKLATV